MKIAICLFPLMDLGGIINHTEQLAGGFKDLGHQVDLIELSWKDKKPKANNKDTTAGWIVGPSGIIHHQGKGWNFPARNRLSYRGMWRMREAKAVLETYDIIVWSVPVPTKLAEHRGNTDWPELYNLKHPRQVAIVHDGNAPDACPHILHIARHLKGIACVHPCAYNGAAFIPRPRAMIVNPQDLNVIGGDKWDNRRPGFISAQTFKAWKHVHDLVEAIAYMNDRRDDEVRMVAGEGIEYRYMVSEEKCKDAYFHGQTGTWFNHMKFWDAALANGMQRPVNGYLTAGELDIELRRTKTLVDPSWSNRYAKVGGHFNRVVVDAIRNGAIPIASTLGMGDEVFKAGEDYVPLPHPAPRDPAHYANVVQEAGFMDAKKAKPYLESGRDKLQLFERSKVARLFIDLADEMGVVGQVTPNAQIACDITLEQFFGITK